LAGRTCRLQFYRNGVPYPFRWHPVGCLGYGHSPTHRSRQKLSPAMRLARGGGFWAPRPPGFRGREWSMGCTDAPIRRSALICLSILSVQSLMCRSPHLPDRHPGDQWPTPCQG
jgi:hypothetical protein